jgi:hypothetical protein
MAGKLLMSSRSRPTAGHADVQCLYEGCIYRESNEGQGITSFEEGRSEVF